MTPSEEKLFILDLLKLNSSERMYSEETVINIIKQVLKMNKPVEQDTEIDVPKYPTSYRDFTMTEKIDQESIKDTYKNLLNQESNTDNTVQEKQSQTAEDVFEKYQKDAPMKTRFVNPERVIEAMEEYASQKLSENEDKWQSYHDKRIKEVSQSQSSVLPSEEDIEKKYPTKTLFDLVTASNNIFRQEGAKWFKSQLKQGYEKEFFIWHLEDANNFFPQRNEKDELVFWDMSQNKGITLDELYQYWLTIKDK